MIRRPPRSTRTDPLFPYTTLFRSVIRTTDVANLSFIPAGPIPPSPTELLGSPRLVAVLDELRGNFDIIILDGPPLLGLADAPLIASIVGNAVFVVRSEERRVGKACVRTCRFRW